MKIKKGDVIHLVFEKYGTIRDFKVDRIKKMPKLKEYGIKEYQYLGLEEIK